MKVVSVRSLKSQQPLLAMEEKSHNLPITISVYPSAKRAVYEAMNLYKSEAISLEVAWFSQEYWNLPR